jgi:hypothetical protein
MRVTDATRGAGATTRAAATSRPAAPPRGHAIRRRTPGPTRRAERFATLILARHGVGRERTARHVPAFRRAPDALARRASRHVHLHVAPRLAVAIHDPSPRGVMATRAFTSDATAGRQPAPASAHGHPSDALGAGRRQGLDAALLRRLGARLARIESVVAAPTPGMSLGRADRQSRPDAERGNAAVGGRPVPRVLRRAEPPPADADPAPAGWGTPSRSAVGAGRAELSTADVGRLADQVMQTLDHRILAHRERRGRI